MRTRYRRIGGLEYVGGPYEFSTRSVAYNGPDDFSTRSIALSETAKILLATAGFATIPIVTAYIWIRSR